jgi:hypothetical protein
MAHMTTGKQKFSVRLENLPKGRESRVGFYGSFSSYFISFAYLVLVFWFLAATHLPGFNQLCWEDTISTSYFLSLLLGSLVVWMHLVHTLITSYLKHQCISPPVVTFTWSVHQVKIILTCKPARAAWNQWGKLPSTLEVGWRYLSEDSQGSQGPVPQNGNFPITTPFYSPLPFPSLFFSSFHYFLRSSPI